MRKVAEMNAATKSICIHGIQSTYFTHKRTIPSHSVKLTGGGGFLSSIRTTRDSLGGGRKLLRATLRLIYLGELGIDRQSTVQGFSWSRRQSSKFFLKHNDGTAKHGAVREEFKNDRTRNLVRQITTMKRSRAIWYEWRLLNDFSLCDRVFDAFQDSADHATVHFQRHDILGFAREEQSYFRTGTNF
jgi:hypothetical protein